MQASLDPALSLREESSGVGPKISLALMSSSGTVKLPLNLPDEYTAVEIISQRPYPS